MHFNVQLYLLEEPLLLWQIGHAAPTEIIAGNPSLADDHGTQPPIISPWGVFYVVVTIETIDL